jgi:hypothetical protein
MRWPTAGLQHGTLYLEWGHAKISNTDVVPVIQQQVLRFEITVTVTQWESVTSIWSIENEALPNGMTVAKIQSRNNLSEEPSCLLWSQTTLLHQVIKEFATRDMFQNQITARTIATHQ